MDTIHIERLVCYGKHGVYEKERSVEQEFQVDITLSLDTETAGRSDRLSDTVDYDEVRNIAHDVINGAKTYLIEKIAEEIAGKILKNNLVKQVSVSIRKVAVWGDGVPGVTIVRSRQS